MADYYDILGVSRSASADEIKKAYRQKVRVTHPDRNKNDPNAAKKFGDVQKAYDVLSDPEQRKVYDQFGEAAFDRSAAAAGAPGGNPFAGFNPFGSAGGRTYTWTNPGASSNGGRAGGDASVFEDLLRNFGGGFGGFGRAGTADDEPETDNVEADLTISFYEAVKGGSKQVTLATPVGQRTLDVKIPAGIKDGGKLRLRGQGAAGRGGPGDLVLNVHVSADPRFERDGINLSTTVNVSAPDAVLGAKAEAPTLDGSVSVKIPPGTSSGSKLRIRGQGGYKSDGTRGDLIVAVHVTVPKNPTPEQKRLYEQLRQLEG